MQRLRIGLKALHVTEGSLRPSQLQGSTLQAVPLPHLSRPRSSVAAAAGDAEATRPLWAVMLVSRLSGCACQQRTAVHAADAARLRPQVRLPPSASPAHVAATSASAGADSSAHAMDRTCHGKAATQLFQSRELGDHAGLGTLVVLGLHQADRSVVPDHERAAQRSGKGRSSLPVVTGEVMVLCVLRQKHCPSRNQSRWLGCPSRTAVPNPTTTCCATGRA